MAIASNILIKSKPNNNEWSVKNKIFNIKRYVTRIKLYFVNFILYIFFCKIAVGTSITWDLVPFMSFLCLFADISFFICKFN